MSLRVYGIVFDCARPAALARFWADALGYEVRQYTDEDIPDTTMTEEVARLVSLGASVLRERDENGMRWTVVLDPEGNELCVQSPPG